MPTYTNRGGARSVTKETGDIVMVETGGSVSGLFVLDENDGWEKTSDEPYVQLTKYSEQASGALGEWVEIAVPKDAFEISILTDALISVHANAQAAPGSKMIGGQSMNIRVQKDIASLHINFIEAGKALVNIT